MEWKKITALGLAAVMTVSLAACSGGKTETSGETAASLKGTDGAKESTDVVSEDQKIQYADITIGEDHTDLTASIKLLTNRTDMQDADYSGTNWPAYVAKFNELYPNITVEVEGVTDYAEDSLLRLQGGDWGDIMMIPAVDKGDISTYFLSYGDLETMEGQINYASHWSYGGEVYGVPSTAAARGIVYNKKVFETAGLTELPKTVEEFMDALQAIKDNTDAIPLYTNYAAGWTMAAWDDYIGGTATGDDTWMNQKLLHTADPFADPQNGTGAYNVYKILYDAAAAGLTEDDFTTTDWEGSKGMLNNGEIGCMVLGSWAYSQMQQAGPNAADIGYMAFPITIDGKQYSTAAPDYCFGVNANADANRQTAAVIFVKWMTEQSGFSYNEGGLPIAASDDRYPEVYESYVENDVTFLPDLPSVEGEEDLLNILNADSELMLVNGGNDKVQVLVEHASNQTMSFDEIMGEWNQKWSDAQEANGVENDAR